MIPLAEAQRFVLHHIEPSSPRACALDDAVGLVIGADVVAREPVPPFANSQMDGYALRAVDTIGAPVTLEVVGVVMAGQTYDGVLQAGHAVRIMTGAPLPDGADAVCMVERAEADTDGRRVTIGEELAPETFVRRPGRDVAVGDAIARAGMVLTPARLGMLANQGFDEVQVYPRPRVGVLSTGDELFRGDGPLPTGKIRDANRHTLLAQATRDGFRTTDLGAVPDDESALIDTLTRAAEQCDAILTSGGVSVGDVDLVRVVLEKLCGTTARWMQVAIRPAKPFAFGLLSGTGPPVFGLPGNPVSALVSYELFARPALRRMGGHRDLHRPILTARAEHDLPRQPDEKLHLLRAVASVGAAGELSVRTAGGQESHQLHAMADANALILLADGSGAGEGDDLPVLVIDPDGLGAVSGGGPARVQEEQRSRAGDGGVEGS